MTHWTHAALMAALVLTAGSADALTYQTVNASIRQDPDSGHLWTFGEVAEYVRFEQPGAYRVTVRALGVPLGDVWPVMALSVDGFPGDRLTVGTGYWLDHVYDAAFEAGTYTVGVAFMNDAVSETEDRNLGLESVTITALEGQSDPTFSNRTVWLADAQAREDAVVARSNDAIREHRMGDLTITVRDANGNAVANARVHAEQISHDFLFGASIAGNKQFSDPAKNAAYEQRFLDLFNYATVPMYWNLMEPVQGQPDYTHFDAMVNWCVANNLPVKGHALLWAAESMLPSWMGGLPDPALQQQHVTDVMQRYAGQVSMWEVVNEPVNEPGIPFDAPHAWARALSPEGTLVANEYGHFYNDLLPMYDLLSAALDAGVPFDAVGIQAHAPLDMAFPMFRVQEVLDFYASLGKAIHITEFTPGANGWTVTGSPWRGVWDEAQQADYAEKFYRVNFAHPAVQAISWWDFCDYGAWVPGGGMLREDLSPKPVYDALRRLIHEEWRTNVQGQTYASGSYYFKGFHGRYRITVEYDGNVYETEFHLTKGGPATLDFGVVNPVVTVNPLVTRNTKPTVSGTVANAQEVSVSLNGTDYYRAAIAGDTWSFTFPQAVADGVYDVRAVATDTQGNSGVDDTSGELTVDTTAPVIALNGRAVIKLAYGQEFVDPGAKAHDNIDGDITARVTTAGSVDTSVPGTYSITYGVTDNAGNAAKAVKRTVTVAASRGVLVGIIGDVNKDGRIDGYDVTMVQYLVAWGEPTLNWYLRMLRRPAVEPRLADIDKNGVVNDWDKTLLSYSLAIGAETLSTSLASQGRSLAHTGEPLYE
ncbi:MAG TPA: endo-1,4-beta-xylanase [Candidatus Hydrogenedentes bacterium]|nr:endo-1,4-beta-xylanase [Candidatus Hydrogenedentota bacterium]HNT86929.1 endo-1,4-beta-xylanase [Candidatus Hydrogenedentota bacterium]